ncbi:hypothetical protein BFF78_03860 [Streptomyces fodineus]|uniref:Uncharacterized protein n=2 Tax=Streptomyces fodineus TaxID=1904616 RepID=A0A1D7Y417_9ACTN|nr:hypothetical protein BFF78_03860 [Streptomyces fodineus]
MSGSVPRAPGPVPAARDDTPSPFAPYEPAPSSRPGADPRRPAAGVLQDAPALAVRQAEARGATVAQGADRIARAVTAERGAAVLARVGEETAGHGSVAFLPEHPRDGAPEGCYLSGVTVARHRRRPESAGP